LSISFDILDILHDWNFWDGELYTGIPRQAYVDRILSLIMPRRVVAVIGIRRAGKSFILRQTALRLSGEVGARNILFVNFEDPRLGVSTWRELERIFNIYLREIKPRGVPYVILDEVHRVKDWERWVRSAGELDRARIIVSGSTSKIMSDELSTLLTGRHSDVYVFPLSFEELLLFRGIPLDRVRFVRASIREFMEYGGFPEVVLGRDKKSIVLGYFDDIIHRDVLLRCQIDRPMKLRELARFYMTAVSKPVTFRSIEKFLELSVDTVEKYTSCLETAMLIFMLERYSPKIREQIRAPRKVYAMDVSFPNIIGFRITRNIGQTFENMVAIDLIRLKNADPRVEIYYWRNRQGKEVDFVVKLEDEILALIETTYEADPTELREKASNLITASRQLNCGDIFIITYDYETKVRIRNREVPVIPYWRWALRIHKKLFERIKKTPL